MLQILSQVLAFALKPCLYQHSLSADKYTRRSDVEQQLFIEISKMMQFQLIYLHLS